jgi:hypothetical protein
MLATSIIKMLVLMTEAASISETSVTFQIAWHNSSEDGHLHTYRHENLASHIGYIEDVLKQRVEENIQM